MFCPSWSDTMDGLWKEFSMPIKNELEDAAVVPASTIKKAKTRAQKEDAKKLKKKIEKFDMFEEWVEGDITLRYNPKDHDAKKHLSGWAMRNTNNHNKKVLKKSCLGVFVCSKGQCRNQSGDIVSVRPATSDRARRKQSEKSCPRPGCGGKLTHVSCTGKGGYPVTHFWRVTDSVIIFQSKGVHDHPRPDVVKTTSMAKIALLEYHRRNRHERPKEICKKVGVQIHKSFSRVDRVARQLREVQGIVGEDPDMKKSLIPGTGDVSYGVQPMRDSWDQRMKNENCLSDAFQPPPHSYGNYYTHHQLMSDSWYAPTHSQDAYRFPNYGVPHMTTANIAEDTYHHGYVDAADSCSYDPFREDVGFESHPSATLPISQASSNGFPSRAGAEFCYSPIKHEVATLPDTVLHSGHDLASLMVSPKEQEVPNTEARLHTFNSPTVSRASVDQQNVPELTPVVSGPATSVMLSSGADIISTAFQQAAELPMSSSPSDMPCLGTSTMTNVSMPPKKRGPPELLPIEPKRRKISGEQSTEKPNPTPVSINLDLPSFSDIFDISAAFGEEGLAGRPKSPVYHSPSPSAPASSASAVSSTDNAVLPSTISYAVPNSTAVGSASTVTVSSGPSSCHSYDGSQHSSFHSNKSLTQLNTHHPIRDEESGTYIDLLVSMYLGEKEPDKSINKNEFHVYTERHNNHLRTNDHSHYGSYDPFKSPLSNTQFDFAWYESERKAQRYRLSSSGLDSLISPLGLGGHPSSYEYSSPFTSDLHGDSSRHTPASYSRHLY
ncbi:uncharacterized protein LOC117122247 isoform X2 [Anneissia japonica]|uniref:uncharacterized protein LOC117122247 isoform X2 n=1 Tax=Anneissia japonica TaxID=1529436 RepID=UPI0014259D61|nr:uncharacterized protein LOC117122247 isoform X2 [Anneissia japonica]